MATFVQLSSERGRMRLKRNDPLAIEAYATIRTKDDVRKAMDCLQRNTTVRSLRFHVYGTVPLLQTLSKRTLSTLKQLEELHFYTSNTDDENTSYRNPHSSYSTRHRINEGASLPNFLMIQPPSKPPPTQYFQRHVLDFLPYLRIDKLQRFTLHVSCGGDRLDPTPILQFLSRHSTHLQDLSLSIPQKQPVLETLLQNHHFDSRRLTALRLCSCALDTDEIKSLLPLVPFLQELDLFKVTLSPSTPNRDQTNYTEQEEENENSDTDVTTTDAVRLMKGILLLDEPDLGADPEKQQSCRLRRRRRLDTLQMTHCEPSMHKALSANAHRMEPLAKLIYHDLRGSELRIDPLFSSPIQQLHLESVFIDEVTMQTLASSLSSSSCQLQILSIPWTHLSFQPVLEVLSTTTTTTCHNEGSSNGWKPRFDLELRVVWSMDHITESIPYLSHLSLKSLVVNNTTTADEIMTPPPPEEFWFNVWNDAIRPNTMIHSVRFNLQRLQQRHRLLRQGGRRRGNQGSSSSSLPSPWYLKQRNQSLGKIVPNYSGVVPIGIWSHLLEQLEPDVAYRALRQRIDVLQAK